MTAAAAALHSVRNDEPNRRRNGGPRGRWAPGGAAILVSVFAALLAGLARPSSFLKVKTRRIKISRDGKRERERESEKERREAPLVEKKKRPPPTDTH